MQRYLLLGDQISTWVGKTFAWLIVILVGLTSYDVLARKFFNASTGFAFDVSYYLYAALFMMGGAYALARNQHVRGDMFYRLWPIKVQAGVELFLMIIFFFPGITALVSSGFQFFLPAFQLGERTQTSSIQLPLWPLKLVIPLAGGFMLLQGIVESARCVIALRTGVWPERLSDIEETETRLAKESQI